MSIEILIATAVIVTLIGVKLIVTTSKVENNNEDTQSLVEKMEELEIAVLKEQAQKLDINKTLKKIIHASERTDTNMLKVMSFIKEFEKAEKELSKQKVDNEKLSKKTPINSNTSTKKIL